VAHFEPFNGPATCVRVFLSVLDVHVNRSPCHGVVLSVEHRPGLHLNALNPQSAQDNESTTVVLVHPVRRHPVAAVRQIAGLLARTIVCPVQEGQVLQRGQRFGMIKFGSTTELYLPAYYQPQVLVSVGQKVSGGTTVLATVNSPNLEDSTDPEGRPDSTSQAGPDSAAGSDTDHPIVNDPALATDAP
jgi:phosphatidylserine decarboxylase